MGLSRIISLIDCDFSRKLHNFPTPMYFETLMTKFPLELGIDTGSEKNGIMGLPVGRKSFKMSLAV